MAKRSSRTLKGLNQQIFVSKPIDYTTDADIAAFLANAPLGEIGLYDANGARHTDAITANEFVQVIQRVTNDNGTSGFTLRKSTLVKWSDIIASHKAYVAPVKQNWFLGWTGALGGLNLTATPAINKTYEFEVIETTEGSEPFPRFNFQYTAKSTDTVEIDILLGLAKSINNARNITYTSMNRLVKVEVLSNGTYGNYAVSTAGTLTFTLGSTAVVLGGSSPTIDAAVGDYIAIDPAATPDATNSNRYKVIAISAGVGFTIDRPFEGATVVLTEAQAEGTRLKKVTVITKTGLKVISLEDNTTFRLAVREELEGADITFGSGTSGNGSSIQTRELELEGQTFQGETTKADKFAADFGHQDDFVVSNGASETYDNYHLNYSVAGNFIGPTSLSQKGTIRIAVAKSGGNNMIATLNTLLGVS